METAQKPSETQASVHDGILQAWRTEAQKRLWHLDAALLAPQGAATECAAQTLRLILPSRPADTSSSLDLGAVPDAWNALSIAWADVRTLFELLHDNVSKWQRHSPFADSERDDSGIEQAFLILFAAISDQRVKQLEGHIAASREEATVTQHMASRFLVNASHELRTPLTAVLGFAELLLEETYGDITDPQREALAHIENSAQNLLEIVNNMLDLLHIRAGKLTLAYRPVNVDSQLQDLYKILTPLSQRKDVRFLIEIPQTIGTIEADENILRHIVYHLLSSSLRATPSGGQVSLSAERNEETLTVIVQDTALHLPPEAIANMMDTYPILENSPARGYEGWEIGLPLVQRYIDLHGGSLELESLPERGTTFRIQIPTKRPKVTLRTTDTAA